MNSANSTRKLWVLQGKNTILFAKLGQTILQHPGDWMTITSELDLPIYLSHAIPPSKTKSLLGQEYRHAIFDATCGFNLDAFAMLTGTLVKGSILILLLPEQFESWKDVDSLRWNESSQPIAVPNFVTHLSQTLIELDLLPSHYCLPQMKDAVPNLEEQQLTLQQILESNKPIITLIAKRGRGKSALVGQFTHHHHCVVTAPNKNALTTFFRFAKVTTPFYAPDELITTNLSDVPDYLIIDEAAMIPLPILEHLLQLALSKNSRVLLTTTVDGYEGTGQGFLLRLLQHKDVDFFYLKQPIRWNSNDELEFFSDKILLNGILTNDLPIFNANEQTYYSVINRDDLTSLKQIYYFLKIAHYRTTLVDLRRLFDAHNVSVWQAKQRDHRIAALVAINEGGLHDPLIDEVWKGTRRPRGNLVAQALVAYAGEKLAAKLYSIRINRIAVFNNCRRQHIAKHLIEMLFHDAAKQGKDFLSVSFSYCDEHYRFWLACGFILVHVASHKEASSGNYSVMAIKPITQQGYELTSKLHQKLQRNWYWLKNIIDLPMTIVTDNIVDQNLSKQDLNELDGFAHYYRSYEATYAALCRLHCYNLVKQTMELPILTALIGDKKNESYVIQKYLLMGRQKLMQNLKQEVRKFLTNFC